MVGDKNKLYEVAVEIEPGSGMPVSTLSLLLEKDSLFPYL